MSASGRVLAGVLAPHPPHLVYASNPPQNEPRSSRAGAWKPLLDGYARLRASLADLEPDVVVVHTPHWKTRVGHHFLGIPRCEGYSVDPIFPNLFRFRFDLAVDVELAEAMHDEAAAAGLTTKMMRNPEFRLDYGTITSNYLVRPEQDLPVVAVSSSRVAFDYSDEAGDAEFAALGEATRRAVEATGRRALCLASCSLSHRHFTVEPEDPEDPAFERPYDRNQTAWDRRLLGLVEAGRLAQVRDELADFTELTVSETRDGSLAWLLGVLGAEELPGKVHGYGTVIGTGNAVVEWRPEPQGVGA